MLEKRRFTRYGISEKIIVRPKDGSGRELQGDLSNICSKGVGLYLHEKLEQGSELDMEIRDEFLQKPAFCSGKVRYVTELSQFTPAMFRLGIEFTEFDDESIKSILNRIQAGRQK